MQSFATCQFQQTVDRISTTGIVVLNGFWLQRFNGMGSGLVHFLRRGVIVIMAEIGTDDDEGFRSIPGRFQYLSYILWTRVAHHQRHQGKVGEDFLQACADLLIELSEVPRIVSDVPELRLLAFEAQDGAVRLLIGNEDHIYVVARVDMLREVREVRIASHYPGIPIEHDGSFIDVRVPPRGMIVLDVVLGPAG